MAALFITAGSRDQIIVHYRLVADVYLRQHQSFLVSLLLFLPRHAFLHSPIENAFCLHSVLVELPI